MELTGVAKKERNCPYLSMLPPFTTIYLSSLIFHPCCSDIKGLPARLRPLFISLLPNSTLRGLQVMESHVPYRSYPWQSTIGFGWSCNSSLLHITVSTWMQILVDCRWWNHMCILLSITLLLSPDSNTLLVFAFFFYKLLKLAKKKNFGFTFEMGLNLQNYRWFLCWLLSSLK